MIGVAGRMGRGRLSGRDVFVGKRLYCVGKSVFVGVRVGRIGT